MPDHTATPLMAQLKTKEQWKLVPEHMRTGVELWIEDGVLTGGFLSALVYNDFHGAIKHADMQSLPALIDLCRFIWNYAPTECWGNIDRVTKWQMSGGLVGQQLKKALA
jgi:hypothetical protein